MTLLGFNGGLLGVHRTPTAVTATGVWLPDEQSLAKGDSIWPALDGDPYWEQVELLIRGNGVDNSTNIVDISPRPKTVTVEGDVKIRTNFSKFHGSSIYWDGYADRLSFPAGASLSTGTGDYCWEAWIRCEGNINSYGLLWSPTGGSNAGEVEYIYLDNIGNFGFQYFSGTRPTASKSGITYNGAFHHCVAQKRSSVMQVWVDGVPGDTINKSTANAAATYPMVGDNYEEYGTNGKFRGWINELRFTKAARYDGAFTPPSAPFPNF